MPKKQAHPHFWQDREIRFDVSYEEMQLHGGEIEIDSINSVEDTKGNNGEKGALMITNLRIIWVCHKNVRTNLSIGYNCVLNTNIRTTNSRLRGNTEGLYVMARHNGTRFEFVFTSLVKRSPRLFTTVASVFRAYETTKLYRDLKLRGAIMKHKKLLLLPDEHIYNTISGVWNLSSEQGNLGTFIITNIRVVWFANLAENFNVSIPYLQIKNVSIRESKFGVALVVETTPTSGGYVLGFRVDPQDELPNVHDEIETLWEVYSRQPQFGVKFEVENAERDGDGKGVATGSSNLLQSLSVQHKLDTIEVIPTDDTVAFDVMGQDEGESSPTRYAHVQQEQEIQRAEPVFENETLGLAIQRLPSGDVSIPKLWNVIKART